MVILIMPVEKIGRNQNVLEAAEKMLLMLKNQNQKYIYPLAVTKCTLFFLDIREHSCQVTA